MRWGRPTTLHSPLIVSELTLISNLEASSALLQPTCISSIQLCGIQISLTTEKCHEKPVESLHRNHRQSLPNPIYFAISQKYSPFQPQKPNCRPNLVMPTKGALQWSEHVLAAMCTYVCVSISRYKYMSGHIPTPKYSPPKCC